MRKSAIALGVCVAATFSVTACGGSSKTPISDTRPGSGASSAAESPATKAQLLEPSDVPSSYAYDPSGAAAILHPNAGICGGPVVSLGTSATSTQYVDNDEAATIGEGVGSFPSVAAAQAQFDTAKANYAKCTTFSAGDVGFTVSPVDAAPAGDMITAGSLTANEHEQTSHVLSAYVLAGSRLILVTLTSGFDAPQTDLLNTEVSDAVARLG